MNANHDDEHERKTLPPLRESYAGEELDAELELLKHGDAKAVAVALHGKLDRVVMRFASLLAERDEVRDQTAARRDQTLVTALDRNAEELGELIGKVDGSMAGLNRLTTEVQKLVMHQERTDERLDRLENREQALTRELKDIRSELRSIRNGKKSGPPTPSRPA